MAKAFLAPIKSKNRKKMLSDVDGIARAEIKAGMGRVKDALVKSHEKIVADWEHKPEFRTRLTMKGDQIALYVFPAGEYKAIWTYVDRGTKPHKIRARNAPRLAFLVGGGYEPKTLAKPARTVVGGGFVRPPTHLVRPMEVDHPGSEGRGFTEQIARDIQPAFKAEIDAAFKRAARKINKV